MPRGAEQKAATRERSAALCSMFNSARANDKAKEPPGRGAGCPAGRRVPGGRSATAESVVVALYGTDGGSGQSGERARPDGAGRAAAAPGRQQTRCRARGGPEEPPGPLPGEASGGRGDAPCRAGPGRAGPCRAARGRCATAYR